MPCFNVHGGGFIVGGGEAAIYAAMPFASLACTRTFSIDYRMAPDPPFPAVLDDTLAAYLGSAGCDSSGSSVEVQRHASGGSPLGGEFQVNTYTANKQESFGG